MINQKTFIICVDKVDFFQKFCADGLVLTTDNSLFAHRFYDIGPARDVCANLERAGYKCLIRDSVFTNPQELLELVYRKIYNPCESMGDTDVSIDYNQNIIYVCMPDGRTTYKIKIEKQFITD